MTEVGPVLIAGERAACVVDALRADNPQLRVDDQGASWRVVAPERCVLERASVERALGEPFQLPGDLEALMPAFIGAFAVTRDRASWSAR